MSHDQLVSRSPLPNRQGLAGRERGTPGVARGRRTTRERPPFPRHRSLQRALLIRWTSARGGPSQLESLSRSRELPTSRQLNATTHPFGIRKIDGPARPPRIEYDTDPRRELRPENAQ